MATKRIGIIGDGNVGGALARGLRRIGHEVKTTGNDSNRVVEIAGWGEIVILAVPWLALDQVIPAIAGGVQGKVLIDVSNPLSQDMRLAIGYTTSGGEELQKKLPGAVVVKAFNTVFAEHMDTGRLGDQQLTAFVSSNDPAAIETVLELAGAIGFDPVNCGPLMNARLLEAVAYFAIVLAYPGQMGTKIGIKLLHP